LRVFALLRAHRVPGDIEVDYQPAALQVDAFSCRFGGHHLCLLKGTSESRAYLNVALPSCGVRFFGRQAGLVDKTESLL